MSVLNQASDGLYTVLIALARAIVRFGPRSREDLFLACGSTVASVDPLQLTQTLNRWTELGFFGQEGDLVIIAEPYRSGLGKTADDAELQLPRVVRTVAMLPENNERFWERERSKSADLSRAVAWMLAQDVYTLDGNVKKLAVLEEEQAASVLPVLDGGAYRSQVEASLKERSWPRPRAGLLSTSLSRAVQRLDREGVITLANRSDTDGVIALAGTNLRLWREISHVALPPKRKAR